MAKNIEKVLLLRSADVVSGMPKSPLPENLVEGEIAVNYAKGYETIFIKNNDGVSVNISSDEYYTKQMLGEEFLPNGEYSGKTVSQVINSGGAAVEELTQDLETVSGKADENAAAIEALGEVVESKADQATLESVSGKADANAEAIETLEGVVATKASQDDVDGLSNSLETVSGKADENAAAIETLEGVVATKADTSAVTQEIAEAVSGKADSDAVTEEIAAATSGKADTSAVTEAIEAATSGKAEQNDLITLSATVTSHTADTDIHVTTSDKETWNTVTEKVDTTTFETTLGSGFTTSSVTDVIESNERVTAAALNELSGSVENISTAMTEAIEEAVSGKLDTSLFNEYSASTDERMSEFFDGAEYISSAKTINFYNGETVLATIDATDFIKDGMVDNVEISGGNLVITFNVDSGKKEIEIPLTGIFDPNNYYDKDAVDALLDEKASASDVETLSGTVTSHTADTDVHVTTGDKATWNAKVETSAMTAAIEAATSGKADTTAVTAAIEAATSGKVDTSDFETYTSTTAPSQFVSQTDFDEKLGSAFTSSSVTEVIESNEQVVAAALNELSGSVSSITTDLSSKADTSAVTEAIETATSGKADTSAVTVAIESATSGKAEQSDLDTLSETVTSHTADTDIHVTTSDKETWNAVTAKVDTTTFETTLGSGFTSSSVTEVIESNEQVVAAALNELSGSVSSITTDLSSKADTSAVTAAIEAATSGKAEQNDLITLSATVTSHTSDADVHVTISDKTTWNTVTDKADTSAVTEAIEAATSGKADTSAVTEAIESAVSGKADTSAVTEAIEAATSGKTDTSAFTAHTADTTIHVTSGDKATWNTVTAKVDTTTFETTLGSGFTSSSVTEVIESNERVIAAALNELSGAIPSVEAYFDDAEYDSNSKRINFYHGGKTSGTIKSYIDATAFVVDGMVDNVTISGGNLVVVFNTDAGKQNISIPLTDIFDPSNYYTTAQTSSATEINDALSAKTDESAFTAHTSDTTVHVTSVERTNWNAKADKTYVDDIFGSAFTSVGAESITKVIEDNELVTSAALNELSGMISSTTSGMSSLSDELNTVSGNVNTLSGNVNTVSGNVSTISGNVNTVSGNVNTLSATVTSHTADTNVHVTSGDKATWNTVTSKAAASDLNTLSGKTITSVSATGITTGLTSNADGTKNLTLQVATVDGSSVVLTNYTKGSDGSAVQATDTVNQAIGKLENQVDNSGLSAITVNSVPATLANKAATVTVDATNVILGSGYTGDDVTATTSGVTVHLAPISSDTVSQAFAKLTKEVLDNEEVMAAATNVLSGNIDDIYAVISAHTADTTVHVTSGDRATWNAKADTSAVTASINAATSGKTDTSAFTAHTADTTAHLSSSEHTNLNNVLSGYTPTSANTMSQLESRIAALESIINNLNTISTSGY